MMVKRMFQLLRIKKVLIVSTIGIGMMSCNESEIVQTNPSATDCATIYGTNNITDCRDGKTYSITTIGSQTWMAENLNYDTLNGIGSWCYNNEPAYCGIHGRLYNWITAMGITSEYESLLLGDSLNHRGICPEGWHIPNNTEWHTLISNVARLNVESGIEIIGMTSTIGTNLKASREWIDAGIINSDNYSFSALPAGIYANDEFNGVGEYGCWWASSEYSTTEARLRMMAYNSTEVTSAYSSKTAGTAIRCLKD